MVLLYHIISCVYIYTYIHTYIYIYIHIMYIYIHSVFIPILSPVSHHARGILRSRWIWAAPRHGDSALVVESCGSVKMGGSPKLMLNMMEHPKMKWMMKMGVPHFFLNPHAI